MDRFGAIVIGVVRHVGSGCDVSWLCVAVDKALATGATLVAESTDRLIRDEAYHSVHSPDAQASKPHLEWMQDELDGAPVATLVHPDASAKEVRAYQRRRGQQAKGRFGGRPKVYKQGDFERLRLQQWPIVKALRQNGASWNQIAAEVNRKPSTVRDWVKKYG